MKTSRFSDAQIIAILNQAEAGLSRPGALPRAWHQLRHLLQVAFEIRWDGCFPHGTSQRAGGRKPSPQEDVCRGAPQGRDHRRGHGKKVVTPSARRAMAAKVVTHYAISIRLACQMFKVSEGCYRYQPVSGNLIQCRLHTRSASCSVVLGQVAFEKGTVLFEFQPSG